VTVFDFISPFDAPAAAPVHPEALPAQRALPLGIIAGRGELPLLVAQQALQLGWRPVALSLDVHNRRALARACEGRMQPIVPGLIERTRQVLLSRQIQHVVFAGKVDKWTLLRDPRLDQSARDALRRVRPLNDDALMCEIICMLAENAGVTTLPQRAFLTHALVPEGHWAGPPLSSSQWDDAHYGMQIAKAIGGLDLGQTVVVHAGMVLAVETIEGTDRCIQRGGTWAQGTWGARLWRRLRGMPTRRGMVVKVAKPGQDTRFDIPTVGVATVDALRRHGLTALVVEAGETFWVEAHAVRCAAEKAGISLVAMARPS
jgi:hypothetical protein